MIRILGLQRTNEKIEFGKATQVLETWVFQEKRPAREPCADAAFQPFEGRLALPGQGENARDLIVGVVGVSK